MSIQTCLAELEAVEKELGGHPALRERVARVRFDLEASRADALSPPAVSSIFQALGEVSEAEEADSIKVALGSLMALTHAQRGLIALRSRDGRLSFPVAKNLDDHPEAQLSRTILQAALNGQTSVMVVDALEDARFARRDSVQALALRAVMAVPLITHGRTFGVLYLDNPIRAGAFSGEARRSAELFARIVAQILERDLALWEIERRHTDRAQTLRAQFDFSEVFGESDALLDLLGVVARVAPTDAAVMLLGETGTGKEVIARSLHRNSRRSDRPFVPLNCGALPGELVESELFGHERGAFTGAHATRIGRFEAADGGTLFLDEIGELALGAQAKLLRVLADGTFQRVGGSDSRKANVRIIAATNRDLEADAARGAFRQDLLYRLKVIPLRVPALREREGDIALLAQHFIAVFTKLHGREAMALDPGALGALELYEWPGNVRELANVIERAVILSPDPVIPRSLLEISPAIDAQADAPDLKSALRAYKRRLVERALEASKGDNSAAAKRLRVHPKYLYQLVRELEVAERGKK